MPNIYMENITDHKAFVETNYRKFCFLKGNEFIASEYAIFVIIDLIKRFKIHSILEVGAGIGTIADTVISYCRQINYSMVYSATEANQFCREALKRNLNNFGDLKLYHALDELPLDEKFDLIIIDGKEDVNLISQFCKSRSILLVEGDRYDQTKIILSIFPNSKYVNVTTLAKKKEYAPGEKGIYQGGARIIFLNPDLNKTLFWFKHKVHTFLIRYIRTY